MDFIDEIKQFANKIQEIKNKLKTEEATKQSVILPFIQLLGYNVFDPHEVIPEFTADVGIKKGERVDYAVINNGKPILLIEAKPIDDPLSSHESQLFRYFTTTAAKFAILTNGIIYKFFSDIQEPNKMDEIPFLEFNLFDIKESTVSELKRFKKESFNAEELFNAATSLKYTNRIKEKFDFELKDPSEEYIRFFIRDVYAGKATQNVVDKFKPVVKRALNTYINELLSERIKAAIDNTIQSENEVAPAKTDEVIQDESDKKTIITTALELEAFFMIKALCREVVDSKRITYKDTLSYFSVLFENNTWKWICRLFLDGSKKYIVFPKEDGEVKYSINDIDDIYQYKEEILAILKRFMKK